MRRLLGTSTLSLLVALSSPAIADQPWFRLNTAPTVFSAPTSGTNDNIEFYVVGDTVKRVTKGIAISVQVTGIDAAYSINVAGLPSGATWVPDPSVYALGSILWPSASAGTHTMTVFVRDGGGDIVASKEVEVVVHPALSASVDDTVYEAKTGQVLSVTPDAANNIAAVLWGSVPAPLPDWLHLDANTGIVTVDTSAPNTLTGITLTGVDQHDAMDASTLPFSITVDWLMTDYWVGTLGGTAEEVGFSVSARDDSVFVSGFTVSDGEGGNDIAVARYDRSGALQWKKTLGGSGSDVSYGVAAGSAGSVFVGGYTVSTGAGGYDHVVAKYDAGGSLLWKKTLGGSAGDVAYGIAAGNDGSVLVTGDTASTGAGGYDFMIAKYDGNGTLLWKKTLGGSALDYAQAVAVGSDGSVYVTGNTASTGVGANDMVVAKYNAAGVLQWVRTLGGSDTDNAYGLAVGGDGMLYITGHTNSSGAGGADILLAKYSTNGVLQWTRTLGGPGNDVGRSVALDGNGAVVVTGYADGGASLLLAKYDASGTLLWGKTLDGSGEDAGFGVSASSDGSLVLMGYTTSAGAGGQDMLLARLPSTDDGALAAEGFAFRDAGLTGGTASTLTGTSPLWSSPDAVLTEGSAGALVEGAAAGLTDETVRLHAE